MLGLDLGTMKDGLKTFWESLDYDSDSSSDSGSGSGSDSGSDSDATKGMACTTSPRSEIILRGVLTLALAVQSRRRIYCQTSGDT